MLIESLNLVADYLKPISEILLGIITIYGTCLAMKIHRYTKRAETNKKLAQQILAYKKLEQELVRELSEKTGKPEQTIKIESRKKILQDIDEIEMFMKPSEVRSYL